MIIYISNIKWGKNSARFHMKTSIIFIKYNDCFKYISNNIVLSLWLTNKEEKYDDWSMYGWMDMFQKLFFHIILTIIIIIIGVYYRVFRANIKATRLPSFERTHLRAWEARKICHLCFTNLLMLVFNSLFPTKIVKGN